MAKIGEGYEIGVMKLARAFSEAGFEVIYTELQDPRAIVASAIQESVDHIGITILPDAKFELFSEIFALLRAEESSDIRITAGGFINDEDALRLKAMGIAEVFSKGATNEELIAWAKENIKPLE